MSEQTDTTCCFLVRSKSVGRNTVVIDRVTDLSETIFPPFSSFLSLSLSRRIETNSRERLLFGNDARPIRAVSSETGAGKQEVANR